MRNVLKNTTYDLTKYTVNLKVIIVIVYYTILVLNLERNYNHMINL